MRVAEELGVMMKLCAKNKSIRFPIYETDEFLETNVTELDLDTRGARALHSCGIDTIKKLIEKWDTLDKIKGVGSKTVNLIRESLAAYQYSILSDQKKDRYLQRIIELNT